MVKSLRQKDYALCLAGRGGIVHYELLKQAGPCIDRKMTRMGRKTWQSDFVTRQCTVSHSKTVKDTLKPLAWSILPHLPYFLDLAPSDYHLFASMRHAFAEQEVVCQGKPSIKN
ncbi:hypothetical protein TNCV_2157851 [Trichonephila clavipes]|nr:hypothetical protein TNCV_2157851 [Trichonephila clavipes]